MVVSALGAEKLVLINLALSPGRRGKEESMYAYPPAVERSAELSIAGPVVGFALPRLCEIFILHRELKQGGMNYTYDCPVEVVFCVVGPVAKSAGKITETNARCTRLQIYIVHSYVASVQSSWVSGINRQPLDNYLRNVLI